MKKRVLSALLVLAMVLSMTSMAFAANAGLGNFRKTRTYTQGQFTDVPAKAWYAANVQTAYEMELLNGKSATAFAPGGDVSLAETITLACRLHSIYYTGSLNIPSGKPWYQPYVDYAMENGIIRKGMFSDYTAPALRSQFALILAAAVPAEALQKINDVNSGDIPDVAAGTAWGNAVYLLYNAGIVVGSDEYGTFYPTSNIKRSEVAAIATRIADPGLRIRKELSTGENELRVGTKRYSVGMSQAELIARAGQPGEILSSFAGHTWYVYGTDTYQDFFMAAVDNGVVTGLMSAGMGFRYMGCQAGSLQSDCAGLSAKATLYTDRNDNNILHAILLKAEGFRMYSRSENLNDQTCADESRINFHLTNAFRVYHGESVLTWSDQAAASARLHSQDMADKNYFEHVNLEGLPPSRRMEAQGIEWRMCAENIAAGYDSGLAAYDGWVNSAGHRSNMLSHGLTHLGVGFAFNFNSDYRIYSTQNFYTPR